MNPIRLSILTNKSDRFDINMLDCFGNEHYPFSIEAKSVDSFVFSGDEGDIRYRYSMIAGTGLGSRWGFFTTETIRQKMKEFDDYQIITYDFDYSSFKDVDLMRNGMYNYFIQSDAKYERVEKVIGFKDNDKEVKIEVLDLSDEETLIKAINESPKCSTISSLIKKADIDLITTHNPSANQIGLAFDEILCSTDGFNLDNLKSTNFINYNSNKLNSEQISNIITLHYYNMSDNQLKIFKETVRQINQWGLNNVTKLVLHTPIATSVLADVFPKLDTVELACHWNNEPVENIENVIVCKYSHNLHFPGCSTITYTESAGQKVDKNNTFVNLYPHIEKYNSVTMKNISVYNKGVKVEGLTLKIEKHIYNTEAKSARY